MFCRSFNAVSDFACVDWAWVSSKGSIRISYENKAGEVTLDIIPKPLRLSNSDVSFLETHNYIWNS